VLAPPSYTTPRGTTYAPLLLSGHIDPQDPRIQGLKQTSAERMQHAREADPVDALRLLRRALPDEREVQIKAAATIMALSSGLKGGNRDQVISSLVAAETLVVKSDRPSAAMEGLASASAKAELLCEKSAYELRKQRDRDGSDSARS